MTVPAAAAPTISPAVVEPVKEIMSTPGWRDNLIAHDAAGAVHQVEHARRHVGLVQHLGHEGAARGGVDTGLGDHRAAGGQTRR